MQNKTNQRRDRAWSSEEAKRELSLWWKSGMNQTAFARLRGYSVKRLWNCSGRLKAMGWEPGKAETLLLMPVRAVDRLQPDHARDEVKTLAPKFRGLIT